MSLTGKDDNNKNQNSSNSENKIHNNTYNNSKSNTNSSKQNNSVNGNKTITLSRSTFIKISIITIVALMISSFLGGYTLKTHITDTSVTIPSSALLSLLESRDTTTSTLQENNSSGSGDGTSIAPTPSVNPVISVDDDPIRGNKDASITMIEFSDYQCPFCKRVFNETMPEIKEKYIDTGKVKHVFRDYPIPTSHPNALTAAIAAQCANDEQKYWEYHDILFAKQAEWEALTGNNTISKFKEYADNLGINMDNFNSCLDSKQYEEEVNKDLQEGATYGITGTPTFYVGNREKGFTELSGSQPFASFENVFKFYENK